MRVFDPIAMAECKRRIGDTVTYADNIYDCVDGAYAMLLMTEWRQFRLPSWNVIKKIMIGNIIVDGRNIYIGMNWKLKDLDILRLVNSYE